MSAEVAQAIGAPDDLAGFLRGRELLILLDNYEHLLHAAPTVSTVLAASRVLEQYIGGARERLSPDANAAWAAGRAMAFDDAVELALTPPDS